MKITKGLWGVDLGFSCGSCESTISATSRLEIVRSDDTRTRVLVLTRPAWLPMSVKHGRMYPTSINTRSNSWIISIMWLYIGPLI